MSANHRAATLAIKASDVADDGMFVGYASVFGDVDSYGDVVVPGAYKSSIADVLSGARAIPMLWQHDQTQPIGTWASMEEDNRGLKVTGRLVMAVDRAREAHALMKVGAITGLSIGYMPSGFEYVAASEYQAKYGGFYGPAPVPNDQVRVLTAVDLHEISLVTFPASHPARVESVKRADAPVDMTPLLAALARRHRVVATIG